MLPNDNYISFGQWLAKYSKNVIQIDFDKHHPQFCFKDDVVKTLKKRTLLEWFKNLFISKPKVEIIEYKKTFCISDVSWSRWTQEYNLYLDCSELAKRSYGFRTIKEYKLYEKFAKLKGFTPEVITSKF
jgi:hypothetical protein